MYGSTIACVYCDILNPFVSSSSFFSLYSLGSPVYTAMHLQIDISVLLLHSACFLFIFYLIARAKIFPSMHLDFGKAGLPWWLKQIKESESEVAQ